MLNTVRYLEKETLVMDIASVLSGLQPSVGLVIWRKVQV